jgi:phosphatidylserine/phosphatidylglycerophosphate/cardiolipin synthase-like enzyme
VTTTKGALRIEDLDQFKHFGLDAGYQSNVRRFYSPWDDAHPVIMTMLGEVRTSYVSSDYGFTDKEAAAKIDTFLKDPTVYTQMTFDWSQLNGLTEKQVLAKMMADATGNSIATGTSEKGKIIHRKMRIINGVWLLTGSTNLSLSGEQEQDNELTVTYDPIACAEARHVLDLSHVKALKDMAARAAKAERAAA